MKSSGLLRLLLFIALLLAMNSHARAQDIDKKAQSAMKRVFPGTTYSAVRTTALPEAATQAVYKRTGQAIGSKLGICHALDANGNIVGYGLLDDVRGKSQPITYLAMIRPDGTLAEIEVLVYREPYGGEIQYESFRKQFRGKKPDAELRVGHDITNIAGATISSNAITKGAKKLVVLFDELRKGHYAY